MFLVFTGSGATGRRLMEYSARSNMKRVYLELGGKSPNIVFADAPNLDEAAKVAAAGIFRNAGQVCVAGSRLLVEASIHDEFVAAVAKATEAMRVGDPLKVDTHIGAVNSEVQLKANLGFVETATAEGGRVVTGGTRILEETGGTYMAPTIVTGVTRDATLAQKEVFGPVLGVTPFETEDEAISLANCDCLRARRSGMDRKPWPCPPDGTRGAHGRHAYQHLWRRGRHGAAGRCGPIRQWVRQVAARH